MMEYAVRMLLFCIIGLSKENVQIVGRYNIKSCIYLLDKQGQLQSYWRYKFGLKIFRYAKYIYVLLY